MLRHPEGHGSGRPHGHGDGGPRGCGDRRGPEAERTGGADPRRVRLYALIGVVVCAVALPLAVASAGQVGDRGVPGAPGGPDDRGRAAASSAAPDRPAADGKMPTAAPTRTPFLLGLGLATATRCGPEVASPGGVEAQTCVLTQGADTWARTYYRNATGRALDAALTLMGPDERTLRIHCALDGGDEPGTCDTPREHTRGAPGAYTAVAEFAGRPGSGPMLLRSGSNSPAKARR
ncbi:hypothetical protein ACFUCQ_21475 [Streptomyces sp. NPDC057197]|uniref:hypothetical protein n=1 Tax=unclassified Streptomyces TaxID=2593676 RepID=UPI0009A11DBA|nr:hypothetical protein [Streptomyces sp. SAT1]